MEKRRILFVDDESNVLSGLERMLHGMRGTWSMEFCADARLALERLDQAPFDVVVTDTTMPHMSGSNFLVEVMERHPQVVRIILSGHTDRETTLEAIAVSHQLLAKPCDAGTLKATVGRALALRRLLEGDTPLKALVSRLETLPSLPALYSRIVQELQAPGTTIPAVTAIIGEDPAMTAKVLQLVNSAFFSLRRHVTNLNQAVGLLGLDTIKALVLSAQVFAQFEPEVIRVYSVEALWHHSTLVGALARRLAEATGGGEELLNDALTAGLLHDVGKLILASNLPNIYAKVEGLRVDGGMSLTAAERELFGASHGETGAYLLGLWGLPESIVEAVAYHHHPRDAETPGFTALTLVHVANALAHECCPTPRVSSSDPLDRAYLESLGLDEAVDEWRAVARSLVEG